MAKTDFKALMLARGEKFLLIGAIGIGVLLLLWGVVSALGKGNPTAAAGELKSGAANIRSNLGKTEVPDTGPKIPLPQNTPVTAKDFRVGISTPFEPTTWPDRFRTMPEALMPIDSQIDLFLVSVRKQARDNFVKDEDGNILDYLGLWITQQLDPKIDPRDIKKSLQDGLRPGGPRRRPGGGNTPPGGGAGGRGGSPGQPPGAGGPGGGAPGLPPGMGGGGFGGTSGDEGFGPGPGSNFGPGNLANKKTAETVTEWKKLSEVLESNNAALPAYGVFPERMAVVYLAYPLEEQLKEIQRALRLPNMRQAIAETAPDRLYATDPDTGKVVQYSSLITGGAAPGGVGGMPGMPGVPPGIGPGPGVGPGIGPGPGVGPGIGPGGRGEGAVGGTGGSLTANTLASPVFAGFVVQRRKIVNGEVGEWEEFDHADQYYNKFTLYDAPIKPDTGYLPYFLRPDQGLAAPMPQVAPNFTSVAQLAEGERKPQLNKEGKPYYPEQVRMPSIGADFEALEKILKPVSKKNPLPGTVRSRVNPYGVGGGGGNVPGIPGLGGDTDEGAGVMGGFRGGSGGGGGGGGGGGTVDANKSPLAVKHMLIRFLDTDLLPGVSYQYQVKVKLRNPNFNKKKDVADEKLAEQEFIDSKYFQCRQTLTVPGESHIYAGNLKEYEKKVADLKDQVKKDNNDKAGLIAPDRLDKLFESQAVKEGKRAVVQMQKWVYSASFGAEEERIGAWVQAEMPVAAGEFIGRRTLVELPLWKAALGKYQLTPTSKLLVNGWPLAQVPNQPVGRPVDFRTRHVLMDFEGGRAKARVDDRAVDDEATTELLILRDDGKLEVRKEAADAELAERKTRDKNWKDWIADVRKQSNLNTGTTGPGGFEPGRGGSPPGPGGPGGPGGGGGSDR